MVRERPYAAFAKNDVVVSLGENVFGSHQEFLERRRHASLQQNRLARPAGSPQQRKILHIARADLDAIGIFFHQIEGFDVDCLGDYAKPVSARASARYCKPFHRVLGNYRETSGVCTRRRAVIARPRPSRRGQIPESARGSPPSMGRRKIRLAPPPTATPLTMTTVFSGLVSRLTSL